MGFKEIGKKIQLAREENGLTQMDLAQALGITQAALSNYELGKRRLYHHQIENIAGLLNKSIDFFISEEKDISLTPHKVSRAELHRRISRLTTEELLFLSRYLDFLEWSRNHD
ncbi:MAG: helix-turn-helix domain-containing protein [Desulfomonilia bacterium]